MRLTTENYQFEHFNKAEVQVKPGEREKDKKLRNSQSIE